MSPVACTFQTGPSRPRAVALSGGALCSGADVRDSMRFKDWPIAARIWSAIAVTMASFTTAAVLALWQNDGPARGAPWMLIVALAVAALISGLAGWFVATGIVKPFHKAVDIAVAIARGQLDNPIRADTRDELGWLLHELKQMQKSLAGSVTGIRAAADAINAVA